MTQETVQSTLLAPSALLTATAGLIAFHIGLYTLVGRERKSPYVINRVFPVLLGSLLIAALTVAATLLPKLYQEWALSGATALLSLAFVASFLIVYKIASRFIYFVDSVAIKHLPGIRQARRLVSRTPRPTYSHNTIPVPDGLKTTIVEMLRAETREDPAKFEVRDGLDPQSIAIAVRHQGQTNALLTDMAEAFLVANYSVQYLTASRHPIEFVGHLKGCLERKAVVWQEVRDRIVVIDAYSPHFAFTDSIYPKKDGELASLGVTCVTSRMTFAGMHTASSRAFKQIRRQAGGKDYRKPTLVIYEDAYALADLESPEQYRIFVRHVMPSERMWDGMFTVFVESAQAEPDWRMLQSGASMTLDLRTATGATARVNPP